MSNNEDKKQILLKRLHEAVAKDQALRDKLGIGDKFRFIRDRLHALQKHVEESVAAIKIEDTSAVKKVLEPDEMLVYVHLFNAAGANLDTWRNLLNPKVFYEYSVNRPIFTNESDIETLIRTRPNKQQHAYLTIAIIKEDVLGEKLAEQVVDAKNTIKIKEGSLHFNRLFSFTHNGVDYEVSENGELSKK